MSNENPPLRDVPELEGWITLTEAAVALGMSRQNLIKWKNQGKLKTVRKIGPMPVYVMQRTELAELLAVKAAKAGRPAP